MSATRPGEAVPSPCVGVCRMDARTGWCEGCWRTLDEIAAWSTLPAAGKQAVWEKLALRRASAPGTPQRGEGKEAVAPQAPSGRNGG